jgi:MSHA biogenesis protein MshO
MIARPQRGFTLIELVVTLVIAAIVVGFMSMLMVAPVDAYLAQTQRTELNDSASEAMRLLTRDIHKALPRSVRYGSSGSLLAIELLRTEQALRYREATTPPPGTPFTELNLGGDQNFNVFGHFLSPPARLVVGYLGGNYPTVDTLTPATSAITVTPGSDEDAVLIAPAAIFLNDSPSRTLFVFDRPVKYLCNTTPGVNTLTRYESYAMTPALVIGPPAGVTPSVVARDVTSCSVAYVPDNAQHAELLVLQLVIARNGETVNVMHQVQVESMP